jgi:hypothetical protein
MEGNRGKGLKEAVEGDSSVTGTEVFIILA